MADFDLRAHGVAWAFVLLAGGSLTPRNRLGRILSGHSRPLDKPEGID